MGGTDDPENLVYLTAREHFLAHWLLWRIHRNQQTSYAFFCMQNFKNDKVQGENRKKFSSIAYAEAREAYSEHLSIAMSGIKRPFKSRGPMSEELKKKLSDIKMGKPQGPISKSRSEKLSLYYTKKWEKYREDHNFEERIEKICEKCNEKFFTNTWGRNSKYCSKRCASQSNNRKKRTVNCTQKETLEEKTFASVSEAANFLGIKRSEIYKNQHKIYIFKLNIIE
jgi:hypothetical protein